MIVELFGLNQRYFCGDAEDIRRDILYFYPFLLLKSPDKDLGSLISYLNKQQFFMAGIVDQDIIIKSENLITNPLIQAQLGYSCLLETLKEAVRFLTDNQPDPSLPVKSFSSDPLGYVLSLYSLDNTTENRQSLRGAAQFLGKLVKSEEPIWAPVSEGSENFVEIINRSQECGSMQLITIGNNDVFVASDLSGKGSTGYKILIRKVQNPVNDATAWELAQHLGLSNFFMESYLIRGNTGTYTATRVLPDSFRTASDIEIKDPNGLRRLLYLHLATGTLHKLDVLDKFLGISRTSQQAVFRGDELKFIDNKPGGTRLPFYFTEFVPSDFHQMSLEEKQKYLPKLNGPTLDSFNEWQKALNLEEIKGLLVGSY